MKSRSYLLCIGVLLFLTANLAWCQDVGLVATSTQLDVANNVANVTLLNSSGKDINGYSLSVDVKYLSGYTEHFRHDEDLGPDATPIMAGTTTDVTIHLDQKEDDSLSSVIARVVFVAFKDHTARTRTQEGDDAMRDIVSQRNAIALGFQESADMTAAYLARTAGMPIQRLRFQNK